MFAALIGIIPFDGGGLDCVLAVIREFLTSAIVVSSFKRKAWLGMERMR